MRKRYELVNIETLSNNTCHLDVGIEQKLDVTGKTGSTIGHSSTRALKLSPLEVQVSNVRLMIHHRCRCVRRHPSTIRSLASGSASTVIRFSCLRLRAENPFAFSQFVWLLHASNEKFTCC
jgi:hypothetical protein